MAKKKRKPKKLSTPAALQESSAPAKQSLVMKLFRPRALSTFAFGISGLLAGLLTGLNHFPALGQTDPIPRMMLLAAYLGDPHVDVASGLSTGLAGLLMGACLGFSALSSPRDMAMSVLLSMGFAVFSLTFTGNVLLAGLGFLVGHTPAILSYIQLRARNESRA